MTECTQALFPFEGVGKREVVSRFDGGHVVSDGGALLLRQVEHRTDILRRSPPALPTSAIRCASSILSSNW